MVVAVIDGAEAVALACLVIGAIVLLAGVVIGLWISLMRPSQAVKSKLDEAKKELDDAKEKVDEAKAKIETLASPGLESIGVASAGDEAGAAANAAAASTEKAKSALEQVAGIVGSLPENLRFAGMLVLVGAVLMSVATIQFGGTSLF